MYPWRQAETLTWSIMNQAVQSGETPGVYKLAHTAARAGICPHLPSFWFLFLSDFMAA